MQIHDIIKNRRNELQLTMKEVADAVGVSEGTVSRWESGDISNMKRDKIQKLSKKLNISPLVILGCEEDFSGPALPSTGFPMPQTEIKPRIGRIACGEPIIAEQNIEGHDEVLSSWHADFTLMCIGDSMAPKIEDGDIVAIRMQQSVENGDIAAVRIGDEATLKRVFLHPEYIELRPINPNYDSIIRSKSEMEDIHIEGKAVGLCRNL